MAETARDNPLEPGPSGSLPEAFRPPEPDSAPGKILAAARALFASRGFAATSTRAIAQQAEVNLALIHYHFGNKEKLYRRVVQQEVVDLHRLVGEIFAADSKPEDILPNMPRVALRLHGEHPQLTRVLLREIADGGPHLHAILQELGDYGPRGMRALLLDQIRQGQEKGVAAGLDPAHLVAILFSLGNGLAAFGPLLKELLDLDLSDDTTRMEMARTVEQFIRRALAPGKEV